ncbi:ComEC/Rec2 family competence protein [uncultured Aureimonas sp.]|uniref:ComEC/Rec2 family competence protein n=1 Tax=uncultured Aureimonas sp. TaxID=1604662 RepID=UPI0025DE3A79|nr:ComEC/Rec2 family competence protein [uncultured Aureimonas sp.]
MSLRAPAAARARLHQRWGDWFSRQIEVEARSRTAFALFPIAMMAAAALFYRWPIQPNLFLVGLMAVIGSGLLVFAMIPRSLRAVGVVLLGLAAGFAACVAEEARTDTTLFSGEATVRITGTVVAREEDDRGRYRYIVEVASTERPVLSRPPERARIVVSSRHDPLPIGSTYRGLVRLRPPSGPAFPGAHDFAFASYYGGLGAYGFSLGAPEAPGALREPTFTDRIATLRLAMGEAIREVLPGATGAVASALITGERAGIPEDINEDLRVTGLAHVLSISGFHMALVAGFFLLAARVSLAAVAPLALRWPIKKLAALVALAATGFYFLLAGDNAATERSFVMIAVMLGAVLLDRPALTLRNVGIAAVVVMALSPHVVVTATFQMSFAATAALIGAYGAYARWQSRRGSARGGMLSPRTLTVVFLGMALSSLIAGAATAPFAIYHFQRGAPFSLLANIVATPIFSFWIMPFAMLAVLLMPFGWHALPLKLVGWGLDLVFALAASFADAFPDYPTGLMSGTALVCFSAAILLVSFSASGLRWLALGPFLLGLTLLRPGPTPEFLVFEDGREVASVDASGRLQSIRDRPSSFVWDQWQRAVPSDADVQNDSQVEANAGEAPREDADRPVIHPPANAFQCTEDVCRGITGTGIRVAWSDDYEKLDEICRDSDIAIMARAIRARACKSGSAELVTLRTLRRTGSLGVQRSADGAIEVLTSIPRQPQQWNIHRWAAWPEFWRKTAEDTKEASNVPTATVSDSDGSGRPASPEP